MATLDDFFSHRPRGEPVTTIRVTRRPRPKCRRLRRFPSMAPIVLLLSATVAGMQAGAASSPVKKSISAWVSCTGTSDDTSGAIRAFSAARNGAFTLVVDCPVRLHSGAAIDRVIFIDNGTSVEFTGSGKFFVDNLLHPAFVIANSNNISLVNWNVEWDGSVPVDPHTGSYEFGGKVVISSAMTPPAGAFNDIVLTQWLETNRSITFDQAKGYVKANWVGPASTGAVFYITGDSTSVVFTGLRLYVSPSVGADRFIPTAFSLSANWKSGQTVDATTLQTAQHLAVPHWLTFSGIALDGILMGWQGNVQDAMFENITSHRYSDLQDAKGGNVGGIGKWFPPPHLLYLNYDSGGDPALFNSNIHIDSVLDWGPRVGVARDKGGTDTISGYAMSLKLGCNSCSVDHYGSNRPDGFMDVLPSYGLTVSNVFAEFDSSFLKNVYTAGLRFPATGYHNVVFENIDLLDTAESTVVAPVGDAASATNAEISFMNFNVIMNRWAGSGLPVPNVAGVNNTVIMDLDMSAQLMKVSHLLNGTVSATLSGNPATLHPGASTLLTWRSTGAVSCNASGAWSGSVGASGARVVKVGPAGNHDFNLICRNASNLATTVLRVIAQ
jgi:hypothetical protein